MTTLVTGATGFIGSAVVRRLIKDGYRVRALVRPGSDRRNIEGLQVEVVTGDLMDEASIERAMRGCDSLFHVAADYRLWVPDPKVMYDINVTGTRNIMRAALAAGLKRVVYTSSVATIGLKGRGEVSNESTPSKLGDMVGHYKRSKFLAEEAVIRLIEDEGLPAVIVNPSTPVGPRDIKPTPTGRLIVNAVSGKMPAYVKTGLNIVHVDDVAEGHILAKRRGRTGERYILGARNMLLSEILGELASIAERLPPRIRLPHTLVLSLACLSEAWARLSRGGEPMVTLDGARMSKKLMFFSSEKAKRELGYKPRPVKEALSEAVYWFRENEYY
ncbi:MAG: hopanoid-associated sugar epimerase [Thermodesulfobacteriota bacterium]